MKQSAVTITTSKHVVTQEMVPTFVVPLKRETRVPEHSVAMYVVSDLVKPLKNKLYFKTVIKCVLIDVIVQIAVIDKIL